jgi:hypothetical protein
MAIPGIANEQIEIGAVIKSGFKQILRAGFAQ